MKKIFLSGLFFCLMVFCFHVSSPSAMMKGLSTEELTNASDIVVLGNVDKVKSQWSKDRKTIFTSAEIIVKDFIKGKKGKTFPVKIKVEYEGGEVGKIGLMVSDQTELKKGENVLLFLKAGKSKLDGLAYNLVGKNQGKYIVTADGIVNKSGFSIAGETEMIDNNIPVDALIEKIRRVDQ